MLEETKYEFDKLKDTVNEIFGLNLMDNTRERPNVNARIVFSNILFRKGYTKSDIARYINKHHATVIHYCRNFEMYLKTDRMLSEKYTASLAYHEDFDPVYKMDRMSLKNEIFSLRERISDLSCKIEGYEQVRTEHTLEDNRMEDIYRLVRQRTRHGSEDKIERGLNTWFNGIRN